MNYAMSDIHNDNGRFCRMLRRIKFDPKRDHLFIAGDVFDRAEYAPDPVGLYEKICSLEGSVTLLRGNHDDWLAKHILSCYRGPIWKRTGHWKYYYNSFDLLRQRMSKKELLDLADEIVNWPLQEEAVVDGTRFLFAHAMTSQPAERKEDDYYLMGDQMDLFFLKHGIPGYRSVCGHTPTNLIRSWYGDDNRPAKPEIWENPAGTVFMIDCGCGMGRNCRLGCLCLETGERYYVP